MSFFSQLKATAERRFVNCASFLRRSLTCNIVYRHQELDPLDLAIAECPFTCDPNGFGSDADSSVCRPDPIPQLNIAVRKVRVMETAGAEKLLIRIDNDEAPFLVLIPGRLPTSYPALGIGASIVLMTPWHPRHQFSLGFQHCVKQRADIIFSILSYG